MKGVVSRVAKLGAAVDDKKLVEGLSTNEVISAFASILGAYEPSWGWDVCAAGPKESSKKVLRYLNQLELGHQIKRAADLDPRRNVKVELALGTCLEKLERKHGAGVYAKARRSMAATARKARCSVAPAAAAAAPSSSTAAAKSKSTGKGSIGAMGRGRGGLKRTPLKQPNRSAGGARGARSPSRGAAANPSGNNRSKRKLDQENVAPVAERPTTGHRQKRSRIAAPAASAASAAGQRTPPPGDNPFASGSRMQRTPITRSAAKLKRQRESPPPATAEPPVEYLAAAAPASTGGSNQQKSRRKFTTFKPFAKPQAASPTPFVLNPLPEQAHEPQPAEPSAMLVDAVDTAASPVNTRKAVARTLPPPPAQPTQPAPSQEQPPAQPEKEPAAAPVPRLAPARRPSTAPAISSPLKRSAFSASSTTRRTPRRPFAALAAAAHERPISPVQPSPRQLSPDPPVDDSSFPGGNNSDLGGNDDGQYLAHVSAAKRCHDLQLQLEEKSKAAKRLAQDTEQLEACAEKIVDELAFKKQQYAELTVSLEGRVQSTGDLEKTLRKLRRELGEAERRAAEAEVTAREARQESDPATEHRRDKELETALAGDIQQAKRRRTAMQEQVFDLEQVCEEVQGDLADREAELAQLQAKAAKLEQRNVRLGSQLEARTPPGDDALVHQLLRRTELYVERSQTIELCKRLLFAF